MNAQSTKISSVAENIANSSTTGFKRSRVEFEASLGRSGGQFSSGSVGSHLQLQASQQGVLSSTGNDTDLGISGAGFFVVSGGSGEQLLTRSGAFRSDASGKLVNTSGQQLLAYAISGGVEQLGTLVPVELDQASIVAIPSTSARFGANLPVSLDAIPGSELASTNTSDSAWSVKSSMVAYDKLGAPVTLDLYLSKVQEGSWEVAVYDRAASTNGGFPYAVGALSVGTLSFDENGRIDSGGSASVFIPNGSSVEIDFSQMRQLAAPYSVFSSFVDGNAPAEAVRLEIGSSGVVETVFSSGARVASFRIPLATVPGPDGLGRGPGGAFEVNGESGLVSIGFAGRDGIGSVVAGSLESSTVDIASELTDMIEAQRNFTANSRVFQTSSELFDVLNRL